jgi:hypothetical protein
VAFRVKYNVHGGNAMGLPVLLHSARRVYPIKHLLLLALAAQCPWGFGQNLILHPSAIPGVQLLGPQSPEFVSLVDEVLSPKRQQATNDWLPYSVILTNQTKKQIVGVAIRWTTVDPTGKSSSTSTLNGIEVLYPTARRIQPGQRVVLLPSLMMLMKPLPAGSHDANDNPEHAQRLEKFTGAATVEIFLDGVVFDTGQFVGPDGDQEYEIAEARVAAAQRIAKTVLEKRDAGEMTSSIVEWLRAVPRQPFFELGQERRMLSAADPKIAARRLVSAYESQGEAGLYGLVQSYLRPALQLHR